MNYANIKYCDIANGVGVRTTLFVSGCRVHCPGCFNAEAWDFRGSANQRLIDVPASKVAGDVVLWHDQEVYATHTM